MQAFFHGSLTVCLYFIIAASTMFGCRFLFHIPDEVFRKALHFVLLGSYIPFVFAFDTWWRSALAAVILEILIYPILAGFERFKSYTSATTEREKGEFKRSLLLAFTMLAVCICICWGWLQDRYLVLACMYAWGVGDAFAALVGKALGKHPIGLQWADPHKSVEGSAAMFLTSALAVLAVLLFRPGTTVGEYILLPIVGAAAATFVEMVTNDGMDTVTCPTAAMVAILPLAIILGGAL